MSQWMATLLVEMEKNKHLPTPPIGLLQKETAVEGALPFPDIPPLFSNAVRAILARPKPRQILPKRWSVLIQRVHVLVHEENQYLYQMADNGWSLEDVFGCHEDAPDGRLDHMGLLMLIGKLRIVGITPQKASLQSKSGSLLTYYRGKIQKTSPASSTLMEIE